MQFQAVTTEGDLSEGKAVIVEIDGRPVAICRSGDKIYAFDNLCPHSGARLGLGRIAKGIVSCPLHGAKFDLATGACLSPRMALSSVVTHEVRSAEGVVEVALSSAPINRPQT